MVTVCAVIPTYNRSALLAECLESVLQQTRPADEVIVVDNASTDDTGEMVAHRFGCRVIYARLPDNRGGSGGFNVGMKMAYERGHQWIWCLDSDVVPRPSTLEELLKPGSTPGARIVAATCMQIDSRTGIVSPAGYLQKPHHRNSHTAALTGNVVPADCAFLCCLLVDAEAASRVGFLREDFFLCGDDVLFSLKLKEMGDLVLVKKALFAHHQHNPRTETRLGLPRLRVEEYWKTYYQVRNGYFLYLYGSPGWRAALGFAVTYVRRLGVIIILDNNKLYRCRLLTKAFVDALRGKTGMRVRPHEFQGKCDPRPTAGSARPASRQ
jgi:GT2 family glycosyltransferase